MRPRTPNYRKLARYQRWLLWQVFGNVALYVAMMLLPPAFSARAGPAASTILIATSGSWAVLILAMAVTVVLVLHAEGNHVLMIILCALCAFAPCANFVLLVLVNNSATRTLRRAGILVGFMGASAAEVERALNPDLCKGCSYNLTGNVSGICPECGRPTWA